MTAIAHAIIWLCARIARERPLALIVDDAQWADRASLRSLAYLARRIEDLPVLLILGATRAATRAAAADLLSLLGGARAASVLHPPPLSAAAAPPPDPPPRARHRSAICRDCHRAVAGNPGCSQRARDARSPSTAREAADSDARRSVPGDRSTRCAGCWPSLPRATGRSRRRWP